LSRRYTKNGIIIGGEIRKEDDKMPRETILNYDDLFVMLDHLLRDPKEFRENFYVDRDKEIPFFKIKGADEYLVDYFENGYLKKYLQRILRLFILER
jgi:hypothetical protein